MGRITFLQHWKLNRIDKVLSRIKIIKQDIERLEQNLALLPHPSDQVLLKKNIQNLKFQLVDCSAQLVRLAR